MPGQQVQLADKAARIHHRDGLGEHVGRLRPDNLYRTTVDHDQIGIFIARPEQHIARMSLMRCAVGQEPGESSLPSRGDATPVGTSGCPAAGCVPGSQPVKILRCGPGHRPGQAGLTEHRATRGPRRGIGTRQFIHR